MNSAMHTGAERADRGERGAPPYTDMNTNMISTMPTGAERAERSEASEAPPPYTDMNTNMNVNMISTMHTGAERAERSEASEPPSPLYTDISTNKKYQTLSVRVFCWDNLCYREKSRF